MMRMVAWWRFLQQQFLFLFHFAHISFGTQADAALLIVRGGYAPPHLLPPSIRIQNIEWTSKQILERVANADDRGFLIWFLLWVVLICRFLVQLQFNLSWLEWWRYWMLICQGLRSINSRQRTFWAHLVISDHLPNFQFCWPWVRYRTGNSFPNCWYLKDSSEIEGTEIGDDCKGDILMLHLEGLIQ